MKTHQTALVCGAGGFIGSHLVRRLKNEGFWVRGVDLKFPEFGETAADDFFIGDLRDPYICRLIVDGGWEDWSVHSTHYRVRALFCGCLMM